MGRRLEGKVIKVWEFPIPGESREVLKVPLRLIDASDMHRSRFMYRVQLQTPVVLLEENQQPDLLKEIVFERLRAFFAIPWTAWYYLKVSVEKPMFHGDNIPTVEEECSTGFDLDVDCVFTGKRQDGVPVWKDGDSGDVYEGKPEEGRDQYNLNKVSFTAVLPATPENRAKLKELSQRVRNLGTLLRVYAQPEKADLDSMLKVLAPFKPIKPKSKGKKPHE